MEKSKKARRPEQVEYYGVYQKVVCPDLDLLNNPNANLPRVLKMERLSICYPQTMEGQGYKIVEYGYHHNDGKRYINSFCQSITAMIVDDAYKISCSETRFSVRQVEKGTIIVYYTDNNGYNHIIESQALREILFKRPNMVVTDKGIMIFYTKTEMIGTIDCNDVFKFRFDIEDVEILSVKNQTNENDKDYIEITINGNGNVCAIELTFPQIDFSGEVPRLDYTIKLNDKA